MKLRQLVGLSLMAYLISGLTILFIGLVVVKPKSALIVSDTTTMQPVAGSQNSLATQQPASNIPTPSTTQPSTSSGSTKPSAGSSPAPSTPAPSPSPTPTPAPTPPPPACGSAGGGCTAAQVAAHSSASNCWITYNNKYYIVTSYVTKHPGGTSVFNASTCGHDITGYLNGSQSTAGKRQSHSSSAYTILNSYYVGPMQ